MNPPLPVMTRCEATEADRSGSISLGPVVAVLDRLAVIVKPETLMACTAKGFGWMCRGGAIIPNLAL